jgi:hypothetical protein
MGMSTRRTHPVGGESRLGERDLRLPDHEHLLLGSLMVLVATIPFLFVDVPPIHDLPHHLAQARLYLEIDDPASSPYRVQWLAPQNLIYVVLLPLWLLLPPVAAGKVFTWTLLGLTIACVFALAKRRERSPEAALLAALFAFNFVFYSGFFAFQLGGALFLLWLTSSALDPTPARWILQALLVATLAWAHALWLGVVGLLLLIELAEARGGRTAWIRLSTVILPSLWLAPRLFAVAAARVESGFPMGPLYLDLSFRLSPTALVHGPLGGVKGFVEPMLVLGVLVWIGAALGTNRGRVLERGDRRLLTGAAALAGLWLVFPDSMAMTIQASRRWLPYAVMLIVLGLPRPRLGRSSLLAFGALAHVALLVATVSAWRHYERVELSGFHESLEALPVGSDLLGLAFQGSERLRGGVFLQTFAWGEVLREAELNMSFSELGAGLVLRREPRETPWTYGLNFFPYTVRTGDFYFFDHVLVSAPPEIHEQVERMESIDAVTDGLPWRLYRIGPRPVAARDVP